MSIVGRIKENTLNSLNESKLLTFVCDSASVEDIKMCSPCLTFPFEMFSLATITKQYWFYM